MQISKRLLDCPRATRRFSTSLVADFKRCEAGARANDVGLFRMGPVEAVCAVDEILALLKLPAVSQAFAANQYMKADAGSVVQNLVYLCQLRSAADAPVRLFRSGASLSCGHAQGEGFEMRIFFTGGSGKAGRHVIPYLIERGHRVVNADRVPLDLPGVDNLRVELTESGQVFNALSALAGLDELDLPAVPRYDAIVHFAALPRILIEPDCKTYRVNVMSTYNVLEAAAKLGTPKVIFASSETTYGICFAQGETRPAYLPVDEEHPTVPQDSYAMSKVANEVTARSFQARTGADIYGLRINNVIEPHEYARDFPAYLDDPSLRRRNIFAYIDARDLGQMVERCLRTDGLGYQVFNVANPDLSVGISNAEVRKRFYPDVPVKREMGETETFYAIDKARELLGFAPEHSWRNELRG